MRCHAPEEKWEQERRRARDIAGRVLSSMSASYMPCMLAAVATRWKWRPASFSTPWGAKAPPGSSRVT